MRTPQDKSSSDPLSSSRFLLREDSFVPAESHLNGQRSVHFKSPDHDFPSSEKVDGTLVDDVPPRPQHHRQRFPIFTTLLAVSLLVLAAWMRLAQQCYAGSSNGFSCHVISRLSLSREDDNVLSPALKDAIRDLIIETIRTQHIAIHEPWDYARKGTGGRIVLPITSGHHGWLSASHDNVPDIVIDDNAYAGMCWVSTALPAQVGVHTSRIIYPSHFSIEHLATPTSTSADQAPKAMRLWGVVDGRANTDLFNTLTSTQSSDRIRSSPAIGADLLWAPLATFAYDLNINKPIQMFPISAPYANSGLSFGIFALEILDNWGAASTCLHKFRIYGTPVM